jgi:hypothetical protein
LVGWVGLNTFPFPSYKLDFGWGCLLCLIGFLIYLI